MTKRTSEEYSYITLSCRVLGQHARLVHSAAEAKGFASASDYLRKTLLPIAAKDLGEPEPDLSVYEGDVVAAAAKRLGLTPMEFTARMARKAAAEVLKEEAAAPGESGFIRAQRRRGRKVS